MNILSSSHVLEWSWRLYEVRSVVNVSSPSLLTWSVSTLSLRPHSPQLNICVFPLKNNIGQSCVVSAVSYNSADLDISQSSEQENIFNKPEQRCGVEREEEIERAV